MDDGGEPRLPEPAEGRFDVVVVGGGIVGLAVARELSRRRRPAALALARLVADRAEAALS